MILVVEEIFTTNSCIQVFNIKRSNLSVTFVVDSFHLNMANLLQDVLITQFHYQAWAVGGSPANSFSLLRMIDDIVKSERSTERSRSPITVMCRQATESRKK